MSAPKTKQTILVIDDEIIVRQSLRDQLEDLGYRVLDAANGQFGIDHIKNNKPDLVLTDLRMPEMDGLEVIRQSMQLAPYLPIIVISGAGRITDAVEALKLGAYDYLTKPLAGIDVLEHRVNQALEKVSLILENKAYQTRLEELVEERTQDLEFANTKLADINTRLQMIVQTTTGLTGCMQLGTFGNLILTEFAQHMVAAGGSIYTIEQHGLRLLNSIDPGDEKEFIPFPLDKKSVLHRVIENRKPLFVKDLNASDDINSRGWKDDPDGSLLAFPIPDENGKPLGVITLHSNAHPPFVEQDKEIGVILASYSCETLRAAKASEALQISEQRYRALFNKSNDGIFLFDHHTGKNLDANQAAAQLTGHNLEKLKK